MAAIIGDLLQTSLDLAGEGDYIGGLLRAAGGHAAFDRAVDGSNRRLALFGGASALAAGGLAAGIVKSVQAAGRMQQVETGFKTVFGSAEAARAKIAELKAFDVGSPFDLEDTFKGAQALTAMGVKGEDLIRVMTGVGNAVAAAGGGSFEFEGALRAIGQIQSTGRLMREEMNQLTGRGIPAFEILQEELGLSAAEMGKLADQGIPAGKAIDALVRGFNKRFAGAMADQANTLVGAFSNLQSAAFSLATTVGSPLLQPVTDATKAITGLINTVGMWPAPVQNLIGQGVILSVVGLGGAAVVSAVKLRNLNKENAELLNKSLQAKGGADSERAAEDLLAGALGRAGRASLLLTGHTRTLEAAHLAAARAAGIQAAAAGGIGIGGRRGVPAVPVAPQPGRAVVPPPAGMGTGVAVGAGAAAAAVGTTARYAQNAGGRFVDPNTGRFAPAAALAPAAQGKTTYWQAVGERRGQFDAGKLAAGHAARRAAQTAAETTMMGDTAALAAAGAKAGVAAKAGGLLGKLKGGGSVGAIAAGLALDVGLGFLPEEGQVGTGKRIAQGAVGMGLTGATIGSLIAPGVGTAIGGGLGALVGGGTAAYGELQRQPKEAPADKTIQERILSELEKLNATNAAIAAEAKRSGKYPMDTSVVPGGLQQQILSLARAT